LAISEIKAIGCLVPNKPWSPFQTQFPQSAFAATLSGWNNTLLQSVFKEAQEAE
jgi:hypothetical protein